MVSPEVFLYICLEHNCLGPSIWALNWALAFSQQSHYSSCVGIPPMPNTYGHTRQVRSKLIFSLAYKGVAAKHLPWWHDNDDDDRPEAPNICSRIRGRDPTLPRRLYHRTDAVLQQSHVMSREYREVDLPSAKSKLPDFSGSRKPRGFEDIKNPEAEPKLLLQPESRPISHEQLVVEVKGIYAGLVMVEAKCIDIDEKQSSTAQGNGTSKSNHLKQLKDDQWHSLIALHKQLLHEHHDFFSASQHPSASPALSRLAAKYSMPARMWRHGIHAFLEALRHRLPESLEHMLAFIYIAYSMMALLYETVSTFEDTWIECLGNSLRLQFRFRFTYMSSFRRSWKV